MTGSRGRRSEPTQLKILRGNPGKEKLNMNEPQPVMTADVPGAPEFLTGYARDEWHRIIEELYRLRLVTLVDLNPLAAYCQAYKRWRTAEEKIAAMARCDPENSGLTVKKISGPQPNPLVAIADQSARSMVRYASEFGLTPAARTRLSTHNGGDAPKGKFDGLLAS